jgi:anti-sigma regulatory factor (Ser/Thr protein kinase)
VSSPRTRRGRNAAPAAAGWTTPRLELPFTAGELAAVRIAVAAHAIALGLEQDLLEDTVLVVHELCGNAVRHGGGTGRLRLRRVGDRLVCQVSDSGPGMGQTDLAGTDRPPAPAPGGRGLWLARRFASVRIASGPSGTTVTAEFPLH